MLDAKAGSSKFPSATCERKRASFIPKFKITFRIFAPPVIACWDPIGMKKSARVEKESNSVEWLS